MKWSQPLACEREYESPGACEALPLAQRVLQEESNQEELESAFAKLKKWSEGGCAEAKYALIPFYMGGHGPASFDERYAVELARESAVEGFVKSQYQMGKFYVWGFGGLPKDGDAAVGWFRRAAEGGSWIAKETLIDIYSSGKHGVDKNLDKAEYWKRRRDKGNCEE